MSDSPEAIRADIERTRAELGQDVDALADKVNPSKIADRQTAKIKGVFGSARDRVMGVADDAHGTASSAVSDVSHATSDAAHAVKAKAEGSPLAVGLIAFGAGLLAAALIPASSKEKDLAASAKEQAQPFVDEVSEVAKGVAADLQEPAQEAAAAVQERVSEAAETVKAEATDATNAVKDRASQAQSNISGN